MAICMCAGFVLVTDILLSRQGPSAVSFSHWKYSCGILQKEMGDTGYILERIIIPESKQYSRSEMILLSLQSCGALLLN
jgi:hypothetical protein